jgi:hypothetical protein
MKKDLVIHFKCAKHHTSLECISYTGLLTCPRGFGTMTLERGWTRHFSCPVDELPVDELEFITEKCIPEKDWGFEVISA